MCQIALFLCRCLTSKGFDQNWIYAASSNNRRHCTDLDTRLALMSSEPPTPSEKVTSSNESFELPNETQKKRKRRGDAKTHPLPRPGSSDSDDDAESSSPSSKRPATRFSARLREGQVRRDTASSSMRSTDRSQQDAELPLHDSRQFDKRCVFCPALESPQPYCTQACLRGLTNDAVSGLSRKLDPTCPNVNRHSSSSEHELTAEVLCNLLRDQLDRSLDHAMNRLMIEGAIGHLFRVTLCSHGYTFVAKAVRADHVPALTHEYAIYKKLRPLQGRYIPVCLGLIQLKHHYILPFPDYLTHLLPMSYSGTNLTSREGPLADFKDAQATKRKLKAHGLRHNDFRRSNLLWNAELNRVFMIDFERSDHHDVPTAPSSPSFPSKTIPNPAIARIKRESKRI